MLTAPTKLNQWVEQLHSARIFEVVEGQPVLLYEPDEVTRSFLTRDVPRHQRLIELMDRHAPNSNGQRQEILELGANPYWLTTMLATSLRCEVTCGGHPTPEGTVSPDRTRVVLERMKRILEFRLYCFDAGKDEFPFVDSAFDAVVCGELIEHLPYPPSRMLCEINRVLKPQGLLLLTTPNATSLNKVLQLVKRRNIWSPFSTQSIYGRHNREYTCAELHELLTGCNIEVCEMTTATFLRHRREWYHPGALGWAKYLFVSLLERMCYAISSERGETIIMAARKKGPPRAYCPSWLLGGHENCVRMFHG